MWLRPKSVNTIKKIKLVSIHSMFLFSSNVFSFVLLIIATILITAREWCRKSFDLQRGINLVAWFSLAQSKKQKVNVFCKMLETVPKTRI